jgi:hypothetical protein
MDHLNSAADIKRILDQRRAKGDDDTVIADLVEDTLRRILTPASGLVENVPDSEGYVGIRDPDHPKDLQFVYVNFSGRVAFELPEEQIKKYEPYARWLGDQKKDRHRAAVDLSDAVSVLVAVELATRARIYTKDGSRIRHTVN